MVNKVSHDSETPAHGQQVITACAFIHQKFDNEHKVLLAKRAASKKYLPGVFELPGGHIEYGEDIITGLAREVVEELNMEIKVGDPFEVFTYINEIKGSHSIEVIYFAIFSTPIEKLKLNPEDHAEFDWFTEKDLENVMRINKIENDPEILAIKKGFRLLRGTGLNFG